MQETSTKTNCGVEIHAMKGAFNGPLGFNVYPNSGCCNSKVSTISTTGRCVVCDREGLEMYGANSFEAILEAVTDAKCPVPEECAHHTVWQLERDLERG